MHLIQLIVQNILISKLKVIVLLLIVYVASTVFLSVEHLKIHISSTLVLLDNYCNNLEIYFNLDLLKTVNMFSRFWIFQEPRR